MVNQELVDYIKKHKEKGHSLEQLKDHIVNHGHDSEEVDEAIRHATQENVPSKKEAPAEEATEETTSSGGSGIKKRNPFLVLLFAFITFGIYMLFWLVFTTNELRKNTKSAPNPWLLLLFFIPFINFIVAIVYFWKYSKAINELTGFSFIGLFLIWIIFSPAGMIVSQIQLNKKAKK
jgi:hypothetical protein